MSRAWGMDIAELLRRGAARNPRKTAVIWEGGELSYDDLLRRVDSVSAGLAALGVRPGEHVGLLCYNGPRYLEAWWAVVQLGAVVVPLTTGSSTGALAQVLHHAEIVGAVVDAEFLPMIAAIRTELPHLRLVVGSGDSLGPGVVSFETLASSGPPSAGPVLTSGLADPCAIYYPASTNSVGPFKGAMLTHLNLAWGLALQAGRLVPSMVWLCTGRSPMHSLLIEPFAALAAGLTLVVLRAFNAGEVLTAVERHGVTHLHVYPTLVATALLQELARRSYDLRSLRSLQWKGGPLTEAVRSRILEGFPGVPFENNYGRREVSSIASYEYIAGALKPVNCVGNGPLGTAIGILGENGQWTPPGESGQIVVRSPAAMAAYWHEPELTAGILSGGWVHTGDRGYLDAEGYLYLGDSNRD